MAVMKLGGDLIGFGPNDLQTNTGEPWEDTARVLGCMLDGLFARTAGPLADLCVFARLFSPVVNAMLEEEYPTQGICDLAPIPAG